METDDGARIPCDGSAIETSAVSVEVPVDNTCNAPVNVAARLCGTELSETKSKGKVQLEFDPVYPAEECSGQQMVEVKVQHPAFQEPFVYTCPVLIKGET